MTTIVMLAAPGTALEVALSAGAGLGERERERAESMNAAATRGLFVAAHLLARVCVAAYAGVDARRVGLVQRCGGCGGPHGLPSVTGAAGVALSLSHTDGAVAVAAGAGAVGVDVERRDRAGPSAALLRSVLTAGERVAVESSAEPALSFLRLWVVKEALVKVGAVTLDRACELDASAALGADRVIRWRGHRVQCFETDDHVAAAASTDPVRFQLL